MTDENDRIERATAAALWGSREVDRDEVMTAEERETRAFATSLFSHPEAPDEPQPAPKARPANYVPNEGAMPPAEDKTERNFVRAVFGYDPA
jgi:hypothetical protein